MIDSCNSSKHMDALYKYIMLAIPYFNHEDFEFITDRFFEKADSLKPKEGYQL